MTRRSTDLPSPGVVATPDSGRNRDSEADPALTRRRNALAELVLGLIQTCHAWPLPWRLGLAVMIVFAAVAVRLILLDSPGSSLAYLTLYPAVALAVLVGRLPAGALAAGLAVLMAHLLIMPFRDAADWIGLMTFLIGGSLIVGATGTLHAARARYTDTEVMGRRPEQLRVFIERVPASIAMFDRDMRYLAASRRWLDYFFSNGCDVVGKSHYEVLPEIPERWKAGHRRALTGEVQKEDEDPFPRVDGRTQWLRREVRPWRTAEGEIGGLLIYAEDVTARVKSERVLREVRDDLNRAQAVAHCGSWRMNVQRNELDWSDETYRMFGIPIETPLTYETFLTAVPPDDRARVDAAWAAALNGAPYDIEHRILAGGAERWVREQAHLEFDHDGQLLGGFGTVTDVTDRRKMEDALREREERLRQAVAVANLGFFDHDHLAGTIYCSSRLKELSGRCADNLMTFEDCVACIHPEDRGAITAAIGRAHDPAGDGKYAVEHRVLRPDGSVRWMMTRSQTLFEGEGLARHPVRTIGAVADITEQKQMEQAIRERAALADQLARIAESAPGLICSFRLRPDSSASFPYAAESMREIFGLDPTEVRESAEPVFERMHPEDLERIKASVAISARALVTWHEEFRYRHPTKGEIWLEGHSSPQAEADGSILWHGLIHDVTERKRAEHALALAKVELDGRLAERTAELKKEMQRREAAQQALSQAQRLEAVGRLAGGLVHDFNNALTAIATNLELADSRIDDPQARLAVRSALDAIELSAGLNRRLLTFARQGAGAREIILVNDRIEGVLRLLERTLGPDVALKVDFAPELWPTEIDPSELDSAILNLVVNSRDAMPGGGTLTIKTRNITLDSTTLPAKSDGKPGNYVWLSVEDTGMGMSKEVMMRAGEPFFTTKNPAANTGLGLNSVREFAQRSEGFMTVASQVGSGATVSLLLPRSGQASGDLRRSMPKSDIPLGDGETVLLVDDDENVLRGTHALLEGLGYALLTARSGPEAMAHLEESEAVHVVFSDIVMPGGMSGVDVARRVVRERPGTKVILTTGFAGEATDDEETVLDGVPILRKPYTRAELARALRAALDGQAIKVDARLP